jgi:hypothetical protein
VFAHLGQHPGATMYKDSSPYNADGTLTGYTGAGNLPQDRWGWSSELNRPTLRGDGTADKVTIASGFPAPPWTFSLWVKVVSAPFSVSPILMQYPYVSGAQSGLFILSGGSWYYQAYGTSGAAVSFGTWNTSWNHLVITSTSAAYLNGVSVASGSAPVGQVTSGLSLFYYNALGPDRFGNEYVSDPMLLGRILSTSEIVALSDPSNVDLRIGGIPGLLPIRRYYGTGLNTGAALRRRYIASGGN